MTPAITPRPFGGWDNCIGISNGQIDLIVTTDVGPRIIRCAINGGRNLFAEVPDTLGKTGGDLWQLYGGHRLWHAPEAMPRTYSPDNHPVQADIVGGALRITQEVEPSTGIIKEMLIAMDASGARVRVLHRLTNTGAWAVEIAPWALTVMAPGGVGIAPLPPRGSHDDNLLPTSTIALWSYDDLSDPRWTFGRQVIMLRQDAARPSPQKIGFTAPDGWLAYANDGTLFVKTFGYTPGAAYPDRGSNAEIYTDGNILELESLGPLALLEPGAAAEHTEMWYVVDGIPAVTTENDVISAVLPHVTEALKG